MFERLGTIAPGDRATECATPKTGAPLGRAELIQAALQMGSWLMKDAFLQPAEFRCSKRKIHLDVEAGWTEIGGCDCPPVQSNSLKSDR